MVKMIRSLLQYQIVTTTREIINLERTRAFLAIPSVLACENATLGAGAKASHTAMNLCLICARLTSLETKGDLYGAGIQ